MYVSTKVNLGMGRITGVELMSIRHGLRMSRAKFAAQARMTKEQVFRTEILGSAGEVLTHLQAKALRLLCDTLPPHRADWQMDIRFLARSEDARTIITNEVLELEAEPTRAQFDTFIEMGRAFDALDRLGASSLGEDMKAYFDGLHARPVD